MLHHLVAPYDAETHVHCCTDELDPSNAVDLDGFSRIIFA
jgi:hypothetical protein